MKYSLSLVVLVSCIASPCFSQAQPHGLDEQRWYAYATQRVTQGYCVATAINVHGSVAGYAYTDDNQTAQVAFFTGPLGVGVTTISFGGTLAVASSINSRGMIVGTANTSASPGSYFGFITDPGGQNPRRMVGEKPVLNANGINERGQVTGSVAISGGKTRAFITGEDGIGMKLLRGLNSLDSAGLDINNNGQVLGASPGHPAGRHAFLTGPNGEGISDLGLDKGQQNYALSVNDSGRVTGFVQYKYGRRRHYLTSDNGAELRTLGYLGSKPGGFSVGLDINNHGVSVGVSSLSPNPRQPMALSIADAAGNLFNLQERIVNLPDGVTLDNIAGAINDRNQIAASGSDRNCYLVCPTEGCR